MIRRFLLTVVALLVALPVPVFAQEGLEEEYHKNIKVYQPKPFLKKQRVQFSLQAGATTNPTMFWEQQWSGMIDYHISEYFSAGLHYSHVTDYIVVPAQDPETGEWDKAIGGEVDTALKSELEGTFGLFPERTDMNMIATARFAFTPIFGKFAIRRGAPYWDASVFVGTGVVQTLLAGITPAVEGGVGLRLFLSSGLALTAEMTDTVYWESFREGPTGGGPTALQKWSFRCGLALFLPYGFSYEEDQQ